MSGGISVCIVCRNEADRIVPCLESVAWCDDVIVMDLDSSDGCADIARGLGARVVPGRPSPIVEPLRNEVAALARHEWILALDPDERVSAGLADSLARIVREDACDAVVIPRTNVDFGYWPTAASERFEPQIRMYRRDRVTWPSFPNELPVIADDRLHRLPHLDGCTLVHERNRSIAEALERAMRYGPVEGRARRERGEVFTARAWVGAMNAQFAHHFVHGRAWRDGVPGLMRALVLINYQLTTWIALWEASGSPRSPQDDRFVRVLGWWLAFPWRVAGTMRRARRRLGRVG